MSRHFEGLMASQQALIWGVCRLFSCRKKGKLVNQNFGFNRLSDTQRQAFCDITWYLWCLNDFVSNLKTVDSGWILLTHRSPSTVLHVQTFAFFGFGIIILVCMLETHFDQLSFANRYLGFFFENFEHSSIQVFFQIFWFYLFCQG